MGLHGVDMLAMSVGASTSVNIGMNVNLTKSGEDSWSLRFNLPFPDCPPVTETVAVVNVKRDEADIWVISVDTLTAQACLGGASSGGENNAEFRGGFGMPFGMTVMCDDPNQCPPPQQ